MDLAHEALIGGWPRLRGWIDERRAAEITRRRLEEKADARARLRKEDANGGLLDAAELAEAEKFAASPDAAELGVSPRVLALVADSRGAIEAAAQEKERAAERLRKRNQGLAIALGGGSWWRWRWRLCSSLGRTMLRLLPKPTQTGRQPRRRLRNLNALRR